ncbi:C type lectin fold [Schistosoma japonicum]|nr:C type lectin fold [Schistosoma japonicum]
MGMKGIKGLKGDMGDEYILSFSNALQLIKYTINITPSNYFPKGQKGDNGEVIHKRIIHRIQSQDSEKFQRRKREQQQQQHQHSHFTFRIYPYKLTKKRIKRSLTNSMNKSTHDSSLLFTGSSFTNLQKRKILGVKIIHDINEFKSVGPNLPIGALVVSDYDPASFSNQEQSFQRYSYKNFQMNQLNSLGLFMKIENIHNTWRRIQVKFEHEVTFGPPRPNVEIYNSSPSNEPSVTLSSSRYKEKMVFAFHPTPLTGGSFSGWYGANMKCHETALHRLGIPGFKVLLVDKNYPIERLVKWQHQNIPIINLGSQTVFSKWRDFFYGIRSNTNVPLYDLNGMPDLQIHAKRFWLGGGRTFECDEWTTNSSTKYALIWSFDHKTGQVKIDYAKCDSINYLMCYKLMKFPVI